MTRSPWENSRWNSLGPATSAGNVAREFRIHGFNAVKAMFARNPGRLRKLYLAESRVPQLKSMLRWCATTRIGYNVVGEDDLRKLAGSTHHEGVVADVEREPEQALADWLAALPEGPCCAIWLDGVGNPHNLGAILRSAAHFDVSALLLPASSDLQLSGAAVRVAEGGADAVRLVRMGEPAAALDALRGAGLRVVATLVSDGDDLFEAELPERLVYVMGAEQHGMDRAFAERCDMRLSIPGSGAVESLNVASAAAVFLAQWAARY